MAGVGTPRLLTPPGASPHAFALRPSDAQALAGAAAVFWVGPGLEAFLERPLRTVGFDARIVALIHSPGLMLYPYREGGAWAAAGHGGHGREHGRELGAPHDDDHRHAGDDAHIWLDPLNAARMAAAVAAAMAEADPGNAARYAANAAAFQDEMQALVAEIDAVLAPVRTQPLIMFHDAYQYFERRFGLNAVGSVAISPEALPSARRMLDVRARLRASQAACVFIEPQFDRKLADVAVEGSGARIAALDPLGAELPPGADLYPALMRALAAAVRACAGPA